MNYSYRPTEEVNAGTIRIAKSQIRAAKRKLKTHHFDPVDIHSTRKYFKKIIALLKLNKLKLGKKQFKYEKYYFRNLARGFSHISDSDAAIEAIDSLKNYHLEIETIANYNAIRTELVIHSRSLTVDSTFNDKVKDVKHSLNQSLKRVDHWHLKEKNWRCFKKAFSHSYLRGFNDFHSLSINNSDYDFHEWRKLVKLLRYEITLCQHLSNPWLKNKSKLFIQLSSLLGKANDLSVFCNFIDSKEFQSDSEEMVKIASEIKKQYHQKALLLASRSYDETPDEFLIALKKNLKPFLH